MVVTSKVSLKLYSSFNFIEGYLRHQNDLAYDPVQLKFLLSFIVARKRMPAAYTLCSDMLLSGFLPTWPPLWKKPPMFFYLT
jgi:hypothetical protein